MVLLSEEPTSKTDSVSPRSHLKMEEKVELFASFREIVLLSRWQDQRLRQFGRPPCSSRVECSTRVPLFHVRGSSHPFPSMQIDGDDDGAVIEKSAKRSAGKISFSGPMNPCHFFVMLENECDMSLRVRRRLLSV